MRTDLSEGKIPSSLRAVEKLPSGLVREVQEIIEMAQEFNEQVLRRQVLEIDQGVEREFDFLAQDLVGEMSRWGFFSLWLPKIFGGGGYNPLSMLPFNEELGSTCLGVANLVGAHYVGVGLGAATFNLSVFRKLCLEILEMEKKGEPCLFSAAITEPSAGTDLEDPDLLRRARLTCRIRKVPGGYLLNGTKIFISNGHLATWHVVVAYEDLKNPSDSSVVLAVKKGSPGFSLGRLERKMGQHACPASELVFENCFVSSEWVLMDRQGYQDTLGENTSWPYSRRCSLLIDDVLSVSRAGVGALGAGSARAAFEGAIQFVEQSESEGSSLSNRQWVQSKIGEMYRNVESCRASYWEANYSYALDGPYAQMQNPWIFRFTNYLPRGWPNSLVSRLFSTQASNRWALRARLNRYKPAAAKRVSGLGSIAKMSSADLAVKNTQIALELMGAVGARQSWGIEKILRDSRLLQIYEGTDQINRLNVLKSLISGEDDLFQVFSDPPHSPNSVTQ